MKREPDSHHAAHGQVPTGPVPPPFFVAFALLAAFALGRASKRMRQFNGGACRASSWRSAGLPRRAMGRGPHREKEPPASGEETVGA
jgi:hypothetical protein